MNARRIVILASTMVTLAIAGCGEQAKREAAAHADAMRVEQETAAADLARNYDQARAAGQWDLALAYANQLQQSAPDSVPAHEVQATLADTNTHADEVRDKRRLAALWAYNLEPINYGADGVVVSAYLYSDSKSDPPGAAPVRLVLRRHPQWGRSVYLVLDKGEFDCPPGCKVSVRFDDQPARDFAATKSEQNRSALFIDDEAAIRMTLDKIRVITIGTSVGGIPRRLRFEVGGFDRVKLERKN
jgi:hypothetical protein